MPIRIYNTLSEQKEILKKPRNRPLKLFVCGPTVYDWPHLGNLRTFLCFDAMVKYLRQAGYEVFYLQNITDVDDKIIERASEENTPWEKLARHFEKIFMASLKALDITAVNKYVRATDHISQIIHQIKVLNKKGHVYKIDPDASVGASGGWYFDLKTFPDYGKLSRRTIAQADDGVSRIDDSGKKRNKGDFCVWKFYTGSAGEPSWETEIGKGRPGWHIEDTAISELFLGQQYDLHGAGIDLKFPHHEAEIAIAESASGKKPFVKYWLHVGQLMVNGRKMSKSLGNFIILDDLLKKYSATAFRFLVLSHHYRSPMDFSDELMMAAQKNLTALAAFLAKLKIVAGLKQTKSAKEIKIEKFQATFQSSMEDDFNTAQALASIFSLMKEVNPKIWELSPKQADAAVHFIVTSLNSIGLEAPALHIPPKVEALSGRRELFRRSKQFVPADELRSQIEALGYVVEDTPRGPLILPKDA